MHINIFSRARNEAPRLGGVILGGVRFRPLLRCRWWGVCYSGDRKTVGDWMEAHGEDVVNPDLQGVVRIPEG